MASRRRTPSEPVTPHKRPTPEQLDERISLDSDAAAEALIEALLKVDPESEPVEDDEDDDEG
jgi:hypothetical protein